MSVPGKSHPGATGPRTPLGKKRSSQNALKHGIFAKSSMSNLNMRDVLNQAGCFGLKSKNFLEDAICSQIANNLVQRYAIEQFAAQQKEEALLELCRKWQETVRQENMKLIPPLRENGDRGQLPSCWCRYFLSALKCKIVERGFLTAEDKGQIDFIYGDKPSAVAKALKWRIELNLIADGDADVQHLIQAMSMEVQDCANLIDDEIRYLEQREKVEPGITNELASLPPDDVMEKILRYQSSNSRELARLLANFEALRKLSKLKP